MSSFKTENKNQSSSIASNTTQAIAELLAICGTSYNDGTIISKVLALNPNELGMDSWSNVASLTLARINPSSFAFNGFGYVMGGYQTTSGSAYSTVEKYNDTANSWVLASPLPAVQGAAAGFSLNGFGYSAGGNSTYNANANSVTYQYNDVANSWASVATLNTGRFLSGGFDLNGFGYSMSGETAASTNSVVSERYNDSTNVWTAITSITTAAEAPCSFSLNNFGYVAFGSSMQATQRYNDFLNTWTTTNATGTVSLDTEGSFAVNGFGYSVGGYNGTTPIATTQQYTDLDMWMNVINLTNAVNANVGFALNGFGYSCVGKNPSSVTQAAAVRYSNANSYYFGSFKRSANPPKKVLVATKIGGVAANLPIQLSSNSSYRYMLSNTDSSIKTGESLSTAYAASSTGFRNYELKVGLNSLASVLGVGSGTWITKTSIGTATSGAVGFNLNGLGYSIGIDTGSQNVTYYSDVLNTWTVLSVPTAPLSMNYYVQGAFVLNGFGYICGGSSAAIGSITASGLVTQYNDALGTAIAKTSLTTARAATCGNSLNGFGYISGGETTSASASSVNEQYNDATNSWTTMTAVTASRQTMAGFSLNGYFYVAGGGTANVNPPVGGTSESTTYRFTDSSNSWTTMGALNTAREGISGFSIGGFGHTAGGDGGGTISAVTEQFDGALTTWQQKTSLNVAVSGASPFALNGSGYLAGGNTAASNSPSTNHQQFVFLLGPGPLLLGVALRVDE